jgi:hypothetical protein
VSCRGLRLWRLVDRAVCACAMALDAGLERRGEARRGTSRQGMSRQGKARQVKSSRVESGDVAPCGDWCRLVVKSLGLGVGRTEWIWFYVGNLFYTAHHVSVQE